MSATTHQILFLFALFFAFPASVALAIYVYTYKEERTVEIRYVNRYSVDSLYGGPEEGGWWYDQYTPVSSSPPLILDSPDYEQALREAYDWEEAEIHRKREFGERHRTSSIGTSDPAVLIEEHEARIYPEYTPHYE